MKTKTYIRKDISKRVASRVGATDYKTIKFVNLYGGAVQTVLVVEHFLLYWVVFLHSHVEVLVVE